MTMSNFRIPSPEEIQEIRRKVGLTQSELAKRVGISQSLIARIECGRVNPSIVTLRRILAVIEKERKAHSFVIDILLWKRRTSKLPPLLYVNPSDKVRRAVFLMKRHAVSQLPVLTGKNQVGSISERTIIQQLIASGLNSVFTKSVQEIMDLPFPTIDVSESVEILFNQIAEGVEALLVMDKDRPVGVITKIDVITFTKK